MLLQLGIAHARDTRRNVVQIGSDLAGDQIGFVECCDRNQHVGIRGSACLQRRRQRGIADQSAQVEAVLQFRHTCAVRIDDGDVIGFGHQRFGHRRADPASADDDDLHVKRCLRQA